MGWDIYRKSYGVTGHRKRFFACTQIRTRGLKLYWHCTACHILLLKLYGLVEEKPSIKKRHVYGENCYKSFIVTISLWLCLFYVYVAFNCVKFFNVSINKWSSSNYNLMNHSRISIRYGTILFIKLYFAPAYCKYAIFILPNSQRTSNSTSYLIVFTPNFTCKPKYYCNSI